MEKYTGGIKGWLDVAEEKISDLNTRNDLKWNIEIFGAWHYWYTLQYDESRSGILSERNHTCTHTLTHTYCIIPFIKFWKMLCNILCNNRRQITSYLGMRRAGKGRRERGIGNVWIHYLDLDDNLLYTFVKTHQTIHKYLKLIVY